MSKHGPERAPRSACRAPMIVPARLRHTLLASTAFTGAFIALIAGSPGSAVAQSCSVSGTGTVTVTCDAPGGTITTTNTGNSTSPKAATNDRNQVFSGNVVGNVTAGTTIDGFGLALLTGSGTATMTNNGIVTTSAVGGSALSLTSAFANFDVAYSGNGSAIGNATSIGLVIVGQGTGNVFMGSGAAPVVPTYDGLWGLAVATDAGDSHVYLNGGTIIGRGPIQGGITIAGNTSGNVYLTLTGNTAITNANGSAANTNGIKASSATGGVSIISDANIGAAGAATSFFTGINASAGGAGNIAITQTGGTIFATDTGIAAAHTGSGSTTVNTAAGSAITMLGGTGIGASTTGTGGVTVTHAGTISGATTTGISAQITNAANASNVVLTNNGSVTAIGGTGIDAATNGTGSVTVTGNGSVTAGFGISAAGTGGGDVTVTGSGNVTTTGLGVRATATGGNGNVVIAYDGVVASGGIGVSTLANGTGTSNVTISKDVTGGSPVAVLVVTQDGANTLSVTGGTVRTNFPGANAISAISTTGNIDLSIGPAAAVNTWPSGGGTGVVASSTTGNIAIRNSGTIVGDMGVSTSTSGVSTIINAGNIVGLSGPAVRFTSGSDNLFVMDGANAKLTGAAIGAGTDTLRFAGSGGNSFDVSQIGTGWTLIDKTDASNWTLTGTSTTAADVVVNGGILSVNGNIASAGSVTVNAGGTLGGNGTVSSTSINAGGVLAPGNSIGTLTVAGNLVFGAGSIYRVEFAGASDRTNVTGTATLTGGTVQLVPTGTSFAKTFTILSAAGGLGGTTFAGVTGSNLIGTLSYTATDVIVDVTAALGAGAALTPNQSSVAGTLNTIFNTGGTLPTANIFNLTGGSLSAALDQLSGEVHASTAGALVDESSYMRSAILGRLRQASYGGEASMAALSMGGPQTMFADEAIEGALAYAKSPIVTKAPGKAPRPTSDIVFWSQGFGAWGKFNSDGNAAALNRNVAGFISGFDMRFGDWRGGLAAGYTASHNNTEGRGSADVESGHVALYGGTRVGAFNLRAGGTFAWHTIDTDRTIAFPGFSDRATARYDGRTGQIFGEAGYGLAFGKVAVEPFAGAAWVHLDTDSFSEKGGAAALNGAATTFEVGFSTLGVRAASLVPLDNGMVLIPRASAVWQHAFGGVTPAAALAFQLAPANPFTISGVPIARDAALVETGLDLAINSHATVGVSYTGQFAGNVADHAAKGRFSWRF